MKTTETPAPLPAESGATVSKIDVPVPGPAGKKREGGVLNVFSHGVLIIWAIMVVTPLLWAVMT
ncbi:carbohydrate ABC transporter permease, partial [Streptomyces broussonetiae]